MKRLQGNMARWWQLVGLLAWLLARPVEAADPAGVEFFESRIRPVLVEHCYACHSRQAESAGDLRGGLRLDDAAGVRAGGDSGPLRSETQPADSVLLRSLRYEDLQMPPQGRLDEAVIADFARWLELGLPMPDDDSGDTRDASDRQSMSSARERARDFWAFQPPRRHPLPRVRDGSWPRQGIDHFVLAALEERQLSPSPPADRNAWLRRVTLDLIGLPPTPAEYAALENDSSPDALSRVVDRLLASPHYGERWGRYWLDLARYADDQGNSFLSPAPRAYLYRDWVLSALNRDLPYDEFLRLQIAGDEMPEPPADGDYRTRLAGLGFQGVGPIFRKGAAGEAKAKADELEDRIDTLSRGILGLTVSCARCHDHKFDPIPTRDYYALASAYNEAVWSDRVLDSPQAIEAHRAWGAAVAAAKSQLDGQLAAYGRSAAIAALGQLDRYLVAAAAVVIARREASTDWTEEAVASRTNLHPRFLQRLVARWEQEPSDAGWQEWRQAVASVQRVESLEQLASLPSIGSLSIRWRDDLAAALQAHEAATAAAKEATATGADQHAPVGPDAKQRAWLDWFLLQPEAVFFTDAATGDAFVPHEKMSEVQAARADLERLEKSPPPLGPSMPSVQGGGAALRIFVRGNPEHLGDTAPPGFLQVLSPTPSDLQEVSAAEAAPASERYSRWELARDLTRGDNPLTARVLVNRVWHYHFGRGIVQTLGNFGALGSRPTHPELLDTLAVDFMRSGWSMKWLHRQIVLSSTYQQSSQPRADGLVVDAENQWLWRMTPRRLDVEAYRDAMLAVAGQLDRSLGGPSLDQREPGLKEQPDFPFFTRLNGPDPDDPANRRRTLYSAISRYSPAQTLLLFDFPEPNVASDLRGTTTVPQQQLFVLNGLFTLEVGRAFAARVQREAEGDDGRIEQAWRLAYGRRPTPVEREVAMRFLAETREERSQQGDASDPGNGFGPWERLAHGLLSSNEFVFTP
jgi:hypothetical protein